MLIKKDLEDLYLAKFRSAQQIADAKGVSVHQVVYWLDKYEIKRRTVSEAIYSWHNPDGDPFTYTPPITKEDYELWGLGIGLYWGEGNKANKNHVRIGNSDPAMIRVFMEFLNRFFKIDKSSLRFQLHLFSDLDLNKTRKFWENSLGVNKFQFNKTMVTITGKLGTYRKKSEFGVITLYYGNTKVRNILVSSLPS